MKATVFFLSLMVIFLSYYPSYRHFSRTPPNRVWAGTTFYSDDYAVYLHTLYQGIKGKWSVINKFTHEPHTGSLIHIYYLLAGKPIAVAVKLFSPATPPDQIAILAYHLLRFLSTIAFLGSAWEFVKAITRDNTIRLTSWIFITLSNALPGRYFFPTLSSWLPLLAEPEATTRFAGQSHHAFGSALMLASLTLLLKYQAKPSPRLLILAIIASFLNSWIEPNTSLASLLVIAIFVSHKLVTKSLSKPLASYCLSVASIAAPALIYFRLLNLTEPWKTLFLFDLSQHFNPTPVMLISAFGILSLLSLPGLYLTLLKGKNLPKLINKDSAILIFSWIAAFTILFFFSPLVKINRLRFYHQPLFVPLSLLATLAVFHFSRISKRYPKTFGLALSLVLLLPSIPTTLASFKSRIHEYDDLSPVIYPSVNHVSAFRYLAANTPPDAVVLSLYTAGTVIPFFSGNTVYAANITETLNYSQKSRLATDFFQGKLAPAQAESFLKSIPVSYIYFAFQENQGLDPFSLPFLTPVYQNPEALIFQVI